MMFPFTIKGHNKQLVALFDSGATHTFVSKDISLRVQPLASRNSNKTLAPLAAVKSVRTADGSTIPVLGSVALRVSWGCLADENVSGFRDCCAHILPNLLPGVDMIVGQDFLLKNHVTLNYDTHPNTAYLGRCSSGGRVRLEALTQPSCNLSQSHSQTPWSPDRRGSPLPPCPLHPPSSSRWLPGLSETTTSPDIPGVLNALQANRILSQGGTCMLVHIRPTSDEHFPTENLSAPTAATQG
jgi:hypothetical protein